MGVDLIAPSLPAIAHNLGVSDGFSKNLIAIYFLGYALGNFLIGILSDVYGRRHFFIAGSCLFVLASFLPVVFANPHVLLLSRLLQGSTIGCCNVTSRGVLMDVLNKEAIVRIMPLNATMWGLGPVVGPVIGGYLQFYFGWQACFMFFGVLGAIIALAVIVIIPEMHFNRHPLRLHQIKNNFTEILSHRTFMGASIVIGLTYSLLIVFNTLGPFLIQVVLGHSPVYFGHLALILGIVFLVGTITCRRLVQKEIGAKKIAFVTLLIGFVIALLAVVLACFFGRMIWLITGATAYMFFTASVVYPALSGKGLALFRHLAGNSSAIMSLISIIIVSLISCAMSWVHVETMLPMAAVYLLLISLAALGNYFWIGQD